MVSPQHALACLDAEAVHAQRVTCAASHMRSESHAQRVTCARARGASARGTHAHGFGFVQVALLCVPCTTKRYNNILPQKTLQQASISAQRAAQARINGAHIAAKLLSVSSVLAWS